jgi:acid phosphatase family membrane protein YuiD
MREFIIDFYNYHFYWLVPVLTWIGIQLFKFIYDRVETGKLHLERLTGSGGMPSSHSALVMCLATIVGKNFGINTPVFGVAAIFAGVVIHDAAGVRREVGKQAKIINEILLKKGVTGEEKLKELVGHTPFQVLIGSIIGFIVGIIMPLKF